MMKVFILTTVMAPYRMKVFDLLGEQCEVTVGFETKHDTVRNTEWYLREGKKFKIMELKDWEKGASVIKWDAIRYIRQMKPDVLMLYEYSTKTSLVAAVIARMLKIPYLINCDGAFINPKSFRDKIKKFMICHAKGLLAGSESAKEYFIHYGGTEEKIYRHYFTSLCKNDILKEQISVSEKEKLRQKLKLIDMTTVISVGNFVSGKGFKELLEIWHTFDEKYQLLIIGSGVEHHDYVQMIKKESYKNVKIIDFVQYAELKKYYQASDLFVLNTKHDVWGLVINEAMSCGLPVITTNMCKAGEELVKNGVNGYIVSSGDNKDLKEKLAMALQDENKLREMGKQSLKDIQLYTIENIVNSHIETLKTISGC